MRRTNSPALAIQQVKPKARRSGGLEIRAQQFGRWSLTSCTLWLEGYAVLAILVQATSTSADLTNLGQPPLRGGSYG